MSTYDLACVAVDVLSYCNTAPHDVLEALIRGDIDAQVIRASRALVSRG